MSSYTFQKGGNQLLASIVVPVFNVEEYLVRCVESLLKQTHHNIEIILVDDGSNDHSGVICDELAKQDNRIQVLHKANRGSSSARNAGMKLANGQFILFCDSDDTVESTWVERLLDAAVQYPESLVACGINYINEYLDTYAQSDIKGGLYRKTQYYKLIKPGITGSVCIKAFNKEIIQSDNLLFEENTHYCEDAIFTIDYLNRVSSFYVIEAGLYNYYHYEKNTRITNSSNITYQQMIYIYNKRLPLIADEDMAAYKKDVFCSLLKRFDDLLQRIDIPYTKRMIEAKDILKDSVFQEYISEYGEEIFDKWSLKFIKKADVKGYILLQKVAGLKRRIKF